VILDIETDGFLRPRLGQSKATRVHCGVIDRMTEDKEPCLAFGPQSIGKLCDVLSTQKLLIGHNILGFDLPMLREFHGFEFRGAVWDTLIVSRMLWPDMPTRDVPRIQSGRMSGSAPPHSLEAWGERFGNRKGDFSHTGDFSVFSKGMLRYCIQDVRLTRQLYELQRKQGLPALALRLEQSFSLCLDRMMARGVHVDQAALDSLVSALQLERADMLPKVSTIFPPQELAYVTPKRGLHRTKLIPFNPNSRKQIADNLIARGWRPTKRTPTGQPQLDEKILSALPHPEAKTLAAWFLLKKRLAQIAEGSEAWSRRIAKDGRIHADILHIGTVTHRCSHSKPNLGQVPRVGSPWGRECRAVFAPRPGWRMVGCDADGLEMRMLANRLVRYDSGAFIRVVLLGSKEAGTDAHSRNAALLGLDRETAKTFFYAWLYGAGDRKLGLIASGTRAVGGLLRSDLEEGTPGLSSLVAFCQQSAETGYIALVDGRRVPIRSPHSALNTLLQGDGAVVMKQATVNLHSSARECGLVEDRDWGMVLHVHDEIQCEVHPSRTELLSSLMVESVERVGDDLKLRCPLSAQVRVGESWAETH